MSKYKWSEETETGWMVFYNGKPFWPLFGTKKEAVNYRKWKTANNPKTTVAKCTVTRKVYVEHEPQRKLKIAR